MDGLSELIERLARHASDDVAVPAVATCPRCGGTGFLRYDVPYGDPNFGKLQACGCKNLDIAQSRSEKLRELSRMGALATKSFAGFVPTRGASAYSKVAL